MIEVKKDKDNAAKLVLKESKRDEVTARTQAAYDAWKKFEQIQQWEEADFEAFKAQQEAESIIKEVYVATVSKAKITKPVPIESASSRNLTLYATRNQPTVQPPAHNSFYPSYTFTKAKSPVIFCTEALSKVYSTQ